VATVDRSPAFGFPHRLHFPVTQTPVASTASMGKLCFAAEVQSTDLTLGRESRSQSVDILDPAAGYTFVANVVVGKWVGVTRSAPRRG